MGLPPDWCTTYIILLDQYYTISERSIASPNMIRRHLLHMDHPLDLWCHPLLFVCSPFEVEGEGELIDKIVVEMVGEVVVEMVREVMVKMVREVMVHLSRHSLLPYQPHPTPTPIRIHHPILPYFPILTHHPILLYPTYLHITFHTPTHLHIFTISDVARANFHGCNTLKYTLVIFKHN